jgi:hypothetical protein
MADETDAYARISEMYKFILPLVAGSAVVVHRGG